MTARQVPGIEVTRRAIASMEVRGAEAIARAAALSLAGEVGHARTLAEAKRKARSAAARLEGARPTAVSLRNGVQWVLRPVLAAKSLEEARQAARSAAEGLVRRLGEGRQAIARHGAAALKEGETVLTHCHSSTVVDVLLRAHRDGKRLRVFATETRPWRQGLVTTRQLAQGGLRPTLVVDGAVQHLIDTRGVGHVLVGADTVGRDGTLVNKIGTSGVARLAKAARVPVLCAASFLKFTDRPASAVPIEERASAEVADSKDLARGVSVLNPVFDRTPARFVTGFVTEDGILRPRAAVAHALKRLRAVGGR